MPIQTIVSGAWKNAAPSVCVGGAWKAATAYVRVAGAWKSAAAQKVESPYMVSSDFPGAPGDMTAYVTLICPTAGATILTSVNGGGWTTYSTPVAVPPGQNLRAYATKAGMTDSNLYGPTIFSP